MEYIVGSRGSALALAQTQWVIDRLQAAYPQHRFSVAVITTRGDRILDRPLRLSRIPLRLLRLNKTAPVLSLRGPGSSGSVSCISHNPGTGSAFCGILLLPAPLLVLRPLLRRVLLSAV